MNIINFQMTLILLFSAEQNKIHAKNVRHITSDSEIRNPNSE